MLFYREIVRNQSYEGNDNLWVELGLLFNKKSSKMIVKIWNKKNYIFSLNISFILIILLDSIFYVPLNI